MAREATAPRLRDLSTVVWRKSSFCNGNACVEVAFLEGHVAIRDSKDEQSPLLLFDQEAWQEFIGGARHAEFDIPTADPPSLMERARRQLDEEVAAFYGAHRKALRSYLLGLVQLRVSCWHMMAARPHGEEPPHGNRAAPEHHRR